ncbi:MAG TPA: hypothetical protein VHQ47_15745 [Phycisphaerae bacterium]|jgi:hypothetical protein|nr:hypothetical protein [Phycisphaerae bacterium]
MAIDGVNTAMTALQFARVLSRSRHVETSGSASSDAPGSGRYRPLPPMGDGRREGNRREVSLAPAAFHWSYRPITRNGKAGAKRVPQFADSSLWSGALNHLG